ncbi:Nucleolar MIF4G domain-containing protein 1 [Phytophthora pseudosyringae]|uniref:Nucleolar MIF4G domain-containing protein 1 n=1 Tax=Phytophthora pseudosyringae TaxID=221518 RepID=A0A8T1VFF3_9STRA|nr:Nucleolar MIF4G domain-containing protein 1 [Phytophthora pseudosyringae]
MATGKLPPSRKAKRKQEREDKKRQKNKRQRKEADAPPAAVAKRNAGKARGKKPVKAHRPNGSSSSSTGITNKFHEFLAEAASARDGKPPSQSADDREIKALEAKLGLGSSSANKSESALKKLKKEYSKDGLGEDFTDFLTELDHISEVVKGRPKAKLSSADNADVESDGEESEVDGSEGSEAGSDFGDEVEMDEETRREMELLQAEDAEFLKGMDELPTDESESESEDLSQFYSEEEEDDEEARANAMKNQQLAADESEEASEASEGEEEQEKVDNDEEDTLREEDESDVNGDIEESDDDDGEEEDEQEKEESVVVGEDIYGRPVIKTSDGTKKPSAYLPPHLRRKLQAEAEAAAAAAVTEKVKPSQMDEQAMRELTRCINGQLNRISESNMESVALEMEKIYRGNGRSLVNEILLEKLLQTTCHPRQVMAPLIKVGGALVAALYHSVGSEVGGFFVEKLVRKLMDSVEEEKKQLSESAGTQHDDDDGRTSKVPVNLMLFVMMLYNFGVVHCTLVYDLFRSFVDSFSSTDIELIHQLLKIGGAQLRADDADALRQMVAAVQQKVGEAQQANGGKQPDERVRFILDLIYDLKKSSKHGKGRNAGGKGGAGGGGALDVSSLKKWLGRVKTRCGNANNPLRVSLHELLNADEDGRWWIVGGTWVGYQQQKSTDDRANDDATNEIARENDRLLKLAEKQHMNTDVRKKIFVALMGAADCFDAYERLLQLHLKEKQEREIVRVLLHCCGQENKFNKYYLVLAEKLCEMDPRYKFTFQLAFWDIFKQMESLKPRRLYNQAQMLAGLVLSSSLSLSCLKVLDFTQLEEKSLLFLRVLMEEILKAESELEMAQVFQRLLQTKKAQLTIDGLAVFFHQHLTSFRGEPDPTTRTLLKKRVKSVKSLLDQLAKSAASAEKEASFM